MKQQHKKAKSKFYFKGKLFECFEKVYPPHEDSYLLAENATIPQNSIAIDVGCGTGIQTINALIQGAAKVIALDINPNALKATKHNCLIAGFAEKCTAKKSNLFSNCKEKADVILFNPPYLESKEFKETDLDGGKKGREILDKFLEQFPKHLKQGGKCFFLQTDLNGFKETEKKLEKAGMRFKKIASKKLFFEELAVYSAQKKQG